jgi:hypothetical protein
MCAAALHSETQLGEICNGRFEVMHANHKMIWQQLHPFTPLVCRSTVWSGQG